MPAADRLSATSTSYSLWLAAAALWVGCLAAGPWQLTLLGAATIATLPRLPIPARTVLLAAAMVALGSGLAGGRLALQDTGALARLAAAGGTARLTATV